MANGREAELASWLSSAPYILAGVRSPSGADFPVDSAGVKNPLVCPHVQSRVWVRPNS